MSLTRSGFPTFVNQQLPPPQPGDFASMNPRATALAGPGAFRAADNSASTPAAPTAGPVIGNFAWGFTDMLAYGTKKANAVLGFVANELQTVITAFLGQNRLTVQSGFPITLYTHGDFYALVASVSGVVNVGDEIYADQDSGAPTTSSGVAVFTANQTGAATFMTVTAVASGVIRAGAVLSGAGVDTGLSVTQQLTSTETDGHFGGKGTYTVSTTTGFTTTTVTTAAQNTDTFYKAASAITADAAFTGAIAAGTGVLNVSSLTGVVAVGQFVQGVGTPANVQIIAQIDGTAGLAGNYQLNYNGPAVSSVAMTSTEGKVVKITRTY